jgi:hypothetical protein
VSAQIELPARKLRDLADFLDEASKLTRATKVSFCAYGPITLSVGGEMLTVEWQDERGLGEYVVKDLIA